MRPFQFGVTVNLSSSGKSAENVSSNINLDDDEEYFHPLLVPNGTWVTLRDSRRYGIVKAALFAEFDHSASFDQDYYGMEFLPLTSLYGHAKEFTVDVVVSAARDWVALGRGVIAWDGIIPCVRLREPRPEPKTKKSGPGRQSSGPGWVYLLVNPSIPDMVKIGATCRTVKQRVKELSKDTSVPTPFDVVGSWDHPDPFRLEREVHMVLDEHRTPGREFFRVSVERAKEVIEHLHAIVPGA